jgi:hypothetical protein
MIGLHRRVVSRRRSLECTDHHKYKQTTVYGCLRPHKPSKSSVNPMTNWSELLSELLDVVHGAVSLGGPHRHRERAEAHDAQSRHHRLIRRLARDGKPLGGATTPPQPVHRGAGGAPCAHHRALPLHRSKEKVHVRPRVRSDPVQGQRGVTSSVYAG